MVFTVPVSDYVWEDTEEGLFVTSGEHCMEDRGATYVLGEIG
jgi:hypothetical protein